MSINVSNHSPTPLIIPKSTRRLLLVVLLISLLMTLWSQLPHLGDKYRVIKDVQNFYWMARYHDPALFTTDYLWGHESLLEVNILGAQVILFPRSLGYGLLFYLISLISFGLDYIWVSKYLAFGLMPLCMIYLFKLGQYQADNRTAVSLSLLFAFFILASPQSISIVTGLQRAFAAPLLVIFIYYMTTKRYTLAAMMIFISLLFYFSNFPLAALAYMMSMIQIKRPFKFPKSVSLDLRRSKLIPLLIALLLSFLVAGITVAIESPDLFFPQDVPIAQNPAYLTEGVAPMVRGAPFIGRAGFFDTGGDIVNFLVLLGFSLLIYVTVGPQSLQRLPTVCWHLLIACLVMLVLSLFAIFVLSSFALYYPSRYTRSTLIVLLICFVGLNWSDFLTQGPIWFWRKSRLIIFFCVSFSLTLAVICALPVTRFLFAFDWLLLGKILSGSLAVFGSAVFVWLYQHMAARNKKDHKPWKELMALGVLGILIVFLGAVNIRALETDPIDPSEAERAIFEFVVTLPKDEVLAGNPDIMSGIPPFARRSVLFRGMQTRSDAPVLDFFDAYYAESAEKVLDFCDRHRLSYLVMDKTDFTPDYLAEKDFFFQPYNDLIVDIVADRSAFILPQLQPLYTSEPLSVIKCDAETVLYSN